MANEIKIVTYTGLTLTAYAYYDNAGTMTLRDSSIMTEEPASSGVYKATISGIAAGDIIKILDDESNLVCNGEYQLPPTGPMGHTMIIAKGSTDVSLAVRLYDATNGSPKTGLTIANLQIRYIRVENDNDVTISDWTSLTALANLEATHTDNHGYEIGEGYYRIDVPDAAFAMGADFLNVLVQDNVDNSILVKGKGIQLSIFEKAAKTLVNKAIQDKTTGAINYYDDDGETVILTHTPTDGESTITRTPN